MTPLLIIGGLIIISVCVAFGTFAIQKTRGTSPSPHIKMLIFGLMMAAIAALIMVISYPWILHFLDTGTLSR